MLKNWVCIILLGACFSASAEQRLVERGLDAFKKYGPDEAVEVWMDGSMLRMARIFDQLEAQLNQFSQLCGDLESWETLSSDRYGSRVTQQVLVLNFRRCPVFARFNTYTREGRETLTRFNLNASYSELIED